MSEPRAYEEGLSEAESGGLTLHGDEHLVEPDMKELTTTSFPHCPWCGYRGDNECSFDVAEHETFDFTCGWCEAKYTVAVVVTVTYISKRKEASKERSR